MRATVPDQPDLSGLHEIFSRAAADVDRGGSDTRPGLRLLGSQGLLGLGAPANRDGRLAAQARVVEEVAAACLSSALTLWAHRMCVEFLELAPGAAAAGLLPALRTGDIIGSTAMAPALRDVGGFEEVPVRARADAGGLILDGPVRWASNLFPGAVVVLPVHLGGSGRAVVCLRTSDPGVRVNEAPGLLALGATASSSLTLAGVRVAEENVLSTDLRGFVSSFRPVLLLLQTALCAGLASESLRAAVPRATGYNAAFAAELAALRDRQAGIRERLFGFCSLPEEAGAADLLRLRLDAARTAGEAVSLEAVISGGAGYAVRCPVNRRLREAAFLPIQSPTEGQLRQELARYSAVA